MLVNVNVNNLALIDKADVYFGEGLNILTGETGAGKSIIIGSVLIALGEKIPKDMIRDNEKPALVEVVFLVDNKETIYKLSELGVEMGEDNQVIISRKIVNGRSTIKVNGETFTTSSVKNITELLIDVHGQHDHQSLLKDSKQLEILDNYSFNDIGTLKDELKTEYKEFLELQKQRQALNIDEDQKQREMDFIKFQLDEIDSAHLSHGEFDRVEEAFKKMSSSKLLMEKMGGVYNILSGNGGVSDMISEALKYCIEAGEVDSELEDITALLTDLESICSDSMRSVNDYISSVSFDEEEIRETENRMNEINTLRQKYEEKRIAEDPVENILLYRDELQEKYDELLKIEENKNEIDSRLAKVSKSLEKLSKKLSDIRKKNSKELSKQIQEVLKGLNFLDARFDVLFKEKDEFSGNGIDNIEFIISTNPGEDMKPLNKVASGGELSRIMLGIKTILASRDNIETLIFDEIDTGISGRTAQKVAERLKSISKESQIICITHLPQIAAMADKHFLIEKSVDEGKTTTDIRELNYNESVEELARMLGGLEITQNVIDNAKEMKELANK